MRECGALLRAALEGVIALVRARAEMKREMRAEDPEAARDIETLKIIDVQEVLGCLVEPKAYRYRLQPPVQAVQQLCRDLRDDVRTHEPALMAAMRSAVVAAIARVDPASIEKAMRASRSGIVLNRKAALWDAFVAEQARLAREAGADFNEVFAKDFLAAYSAEVKRLRSKRPSS
jgi:predicted component of type VI protein secretion system